MARFALFAQLCKPSLQPHRRGVAAYAEAETARSDARGCEAGEHDEAGVERDPLQPAYAKRGARP